MDVLAVMKQRLAEAEHDAERLREAIAVLDEGERPIPAARPRRAARVRAETPPPTAVVPLGKITSELAHHEDGIGTAELARILKGDQKQIRALLVEAEGDTVRRQGVKRNTVWLAITDEDRIAARAAEIEAQDRARSSRRPKSESTPALMDELERAGT